MCNNDTCALHSRTDLDLEVEDGRYTKKVTYVGKYAVVTVDNPESLDALSQFLLSQGIMPSHKMFTTTVLEVGGTGVVNDVTGSHENFANALRFTENHGDYLPAPTVEEYADPDWMKSSNAAIEKMCKDAHDLIVESVRSGMIGADF